MKRIHAHKTFTDGVAIAPIFVYVPENLTPDHLTVTDPEGECGRFDAAIEAAAADLMALSAGNEILAAHAELVQDPELRQAVHTRIEENGMNAEWALAETIESFSQLFLQMEDEYMRAREADIRDVGVRLMRLLKGHHGCNLSSITEPVIVVAKELLPSDTVQMRLERIAGFITQEGGPAGHVAIIAKSHGIPALVGVDGILQEVRDGMIAAMDAGTGEIVLCPDAETLQCYSLRKEEQSRRRERLFETADLASCTTDGRTVQLCANVGSIDDIRAMNAYHPDGVGLFRTEFLFMGSDRLPTEEQQFDVYREAAQLLGDRELIIRTLDIGGDKPLSYFEIGKEANPFLGFRAIRLCLDREDIFRTQLRAILRASALGNLKIMYPMIVNAAELDAANDLLATCKEELRQEGIAFNEGIRVGMMIETPASVIMADVFATKVDFFSIGTNDLTQYVLSADRGNERVAHLYDPFDPAVLRSIARVITEGHRAGISVGMCGELAGDPRAFRILLGMGLDEFSMSAVSIPKIKAILRESSYAEAKKSVPDFAIGWLQAD